MESECVCFANMPGIVSAWAAPHADARKDAEDRMKASKETYYAAGSEMAIGTPECTRYP